MCVFVCGAALRQGTFGNTTGLDNVTCSGACRAGYMCPAGSSSPTQLNCSTDGSRYCEPTTPEPGGGASGATSGGGTASRVIPAGYTGVSTFGGNPVTNADSVALCAPGHFCVRGIEAPCPAGRYSSSLGASRCPHLCPPGYFCPPGSANGTRHRCDEAEEEEGTGGGEGHAGMVLFEATAARAGGWSVPVCEVGSAAPRPTTPGFMVPVEEAESGRAYREVACPPGSYCVGGKQVRVWVCVCVWVGVVGCVSVCVEECIVQQCGGIRREGWCGSLLLLVRLCVGAFCFMSCFFLGRGGAGLCRVCACQCVLDSRVALGAM